MEKVKFKKVPVDNHFRLFNELITSGLDSIVEGSLFVYDDTFAAYFKLKMYKNLDDYLYGESYI